jgi:putative DNA primase/helicase
MQLQAIAQWVLWKWTLVGAKWTKPPYQVNGRKASHSDPSTWTTYADACAHEEGYDGLGFVLTAADPFAVVDLDKCRNPKTGEIALWAVVVVARFATYSEASPTGTGIHILCCAVLPGTGRKRSFEGGGAAELYDRLRYVTVSGREL